MPGYVIHIAIATQYIKKHNNIKNEEEFIKGTIYPDSVSEKKLTHYGKSPAYTYLKGFLDNNNIDTDFNKGHFLHLIADYLFYNKYLNKLEKPQIYDDYDYLNRYLINKYDIKIPEEIKDKVFFKDGEPKLLSKELVEQIIEEVSEIDFEKIIEEISNNTEKCNTYKKLV